MSPVKGGIVEEVNKCHTDQRYENGHCVNRYTILCDEISQINEEEVSEKCNPIDGIRTMGHEDEVFNE